MDTAQDELVVIAQLRADLASGRARAVRERARLSQAELARALGVHWTTVAHWEAGRRMPRGRSATRCAELLWALDRVTREVSA